MVLGTPPGGGGYNGAPPNLQTGPGFNPFPYQIFGVPSFQASAPASLTPLDTAAGGGGNGGGGGTPSLPAPEDATSAPPPLPAAPPIEKLPGVEN